MTLCVDVCNELKKNTTFRWRNLLCSHFHLRDKTVKKEIIFSKFLYELYGIMQDKKFTPGSLHPHQG